MRVAILDDDPHLLNAAGSALRDAGFNCHAYRLSRDLLFDLQRESFDLLLIDWLMPDVPGIDLVKTLRANSGLKPPVLFVTARGAEADVIEALDAGADDCMIKPIRAGELVARVRALLRRSHPQPEANRMFEFDPFRLDLRTQEVWRDGAPIDLTQKEFHLALLMLRNLGKPLSRGHIRETVWGRGSEVPSRTMDTHVSRVRSKMKLRPGQGFLLAPVYSYGYRLEKLNRPGAATPAT